MRDLELSLEHVRAGIKKTTVQSVCISVVCIRMGRSEQTSTDQRAVALPSPSPPFFSLTKRLVGAKDRGNSLIVIIFIDAKVRAITQMDGSFCPTLKRCLSRIPTIVI